MTDDKLKELKELEEKINTGGDSEKKPPGDEKDLDKTQSVLCKLFKSTK